MIDLRFNYPVLPEQDAQFRAALAMLPPTDEYLRMSPPGGYPADQAQAAAWLARPGYPVAAEQVQLCHGGHHALHVIALAARLAGQVVVADPLTYNGFLAVADLLGIQVLACPTDANGMLPDALADLCRAQSVRAVYLMPTLHNPLGTVMPLARRQALVAVAREFDLLLLDDDAYGFLEPSAPPSFAHLAPERSFYIYSLAKPIAPGIRLAYLVAPVTRRMAVEAAIRATISGSVVLLARLVGEWLADGALTRLIAAKQAEAARRQALVRQVFGPNIAYSTRPTSFHVWVPLPPATDVAALQARLLGQGVDLVTSLAYRAEPTVSLAGLRLALGNVPDAATLTQGLTLVAQQVRTLV